MPVASTQIIRGPAFIRHRGHVLYTKGDIVIETGFELFAVETSMHGKIEDRPSNRFMRVNCTPAGVWNAAQIALLWPYANKLIGQSIFEGGTGGALEIIPQFGDGLSLPRAAVTQMPSINFGATRTLMGEVQFTAVLSDGADWGTPASNLYASIAAGSDNSFNPAQLITQSYVGSWGASAPFNSFETREGFDLSFSLNTQPDSIDSVGTLDHIFTGLEAAVSCVPAGVSAMAILSAMLLQSDSVKRGGRPPGHAFSITGDGVGVTLTDAMLTTNRLAYGAVTPRQGQVNFVTRRTFTAGAIQPLFSLTA